MASVAHKIQKPFGSTAKPSELEIVVAQALIDLESASADLKKDLRPLQITAAKECEVGHGRKAVVVFVPVPQVKLYHKVQARLTRELEKKFSDKHVVFVAQRRILPKPSRTRQPPQPRPRSRTLTHVHSAILEDLVFPSEIVGKRTRVKADGSKVIKVFLSPKDATSIDYKLDTFAAVYKRITRKDVAFEFPVEASA
ncbi:ribosomal protein S7e [Ramicandelaber brevisporus]|nr:ribosomal protein S7e [Ramicandelaber brevisporus]